jgi:acetyltransferase-like isoleucine patch superfamily enzyme
MRTRDASTRILVRIRIAYSGLIRLLCLWRVQLRCRMWKIRLGKGGTFEGYPILYRAPDSELIIGDQPTMFSIPRANFAGINRPCYVATLQSGARIQLGKSCGLSGTVIVSALSITLGDNVMCGANSTIVDTDFHHLDPTRRLDPLDIPAAAVVIEDNVWLGMGVTVLKGVRIGRDSVIAAGSVVVKDIPSGVVAGGVPARVLRALPGAPVLEGAGL